MSSLLRPTICIVLGNRPQFIKHAALHRAWDNSARPVVVDTGQHYDYELAGVFMDELELPAPDHSLGVGSASHAEQTARMLSPLEEIFRTERASLVVVYGDTNSTLAGALAAAKLNIPVAHVEAGLRSFDRTMPEEVNRIVADHVSELLLCPTQTAVDNLLREGIDSGAYLVGDVMADIAHALREPAQRRFATWQERGWQAGGYALLTVHRQANTERNALAELIEALAGIDMPIAFPAHPRTRAALEQTGLHVALSDLSHIQLLPPLGYLDVASLLVHSRLALTDSGGLQKEAFVHGIPCVTLRETTEWVETVEAGRNVLTGTDPASVAEGVRSMLQAPLRPDDLPTPYGNGDAAVQIVRLLLERAQAGYNLSGSRNS